MLGFTGFVRDWHGVDRVIRWMASAALNQATVLTNDTQLLNLGKVDFGYSARGFSIAE